MSDAEREAAAIARLTDIAKIAASAMASGRNFVLLDCRREKCPRGERFRLIGNMKSPLGELMNVRPQKDGSTQVLGRFPALDVLAFCVAKMQELGVKVELKTLSEISAP